MWTAVYMVEGYEAAEKLRNLLNSEGFLVKTELFTKDGDNIIYKILAPEFEADEIHRVILELDF